MTVILDWDYWRENLDKPLDRARILHSRNWLAGGTANASTTNANFFEDAPLNTLTYEKWKPASFPASWEYNHGSTVAADTCCIAAHNLGSAGCELSIQYWNGSTFVTVLGPETIETDDPIFALFSTGADRSRYRIFIDGGSGAPEIGVIKFGVSLALPVATYANHVPDQFALETSMRTNQSEKGEFLGRSVERYLTRPAYQWEHIPYPWLAENMRDLQRGIEAEPFFIAWRPDAYSSAAFGYVNQIPQPTAMGIRDFYSFGISMVGHRGYGV